MFDPLPPETIALKVLVADLHDDLEGRVERLRLLLAIESDFGGGRGLLLPGGMPAQFAYIETRQAFVAGSFLSVILLSQCMLENVLAAQIGMESISREIKGESPIERKPRPTFRETISACRSTNLLDNKDEADLVRLSDLRNALTHFRDVNDQSHLERFPIGLDGRHGGDFGSRQGGGTERYRRIVTDRQRRRGAKAPRREAGVRRTMTAVQRDRKAL